MDERKERKREGERKRGRERERERELECVGVRNKCNELGGVVFSESVI